jgi:hypothetical protein
LVSLASFLLGLTLHLNSFDLFVSLIDEEGQRCHRIAEW